tara:strand:+ start:337 stop:720 length:384 start_codon:yes stop_codon:yes gene_type:complete
MAHKPKPRKIILPKPKLRGKRRPTTKINALEQPGEMGSRGLNGASFIFFILGVKFNGIKFSFYQYSVNLLLVEESLSIGVRFSKKILINPITKIHAPREPNATPNNADPIESLMPSAISLALGFSRF